jgi:4'-phosphopantetheinyl transferase EntD
LPSDEAGLPVWPSGFVGSISHSREHIAVALARSDGWASIGIDVDDARSLDEAVDVVAIPGEIESLEAVIDPGITTVRLAFCAKEALFKCQFLLTGNGELDFLDVQLYPGEYPKTLGAIASEGTDPDVAKLLRYLSVQWVIANDVTLLLALLPHPNKSV